MERGNPISKFARAVVRAYERRLNFGGQHTWVDRSRGKEQLLLIVAGYSPNLWPLSLERVAAFVGNEVDVCVVSPGVESEELSTACAQHGWSYLHTKANKLALAQNIAVSKHPLAKWIFKLDEDIFIAQGYFNGLLRTWAHVEEQGKYTPGFVAPLINVNGYSYLYFLEHVGRLGEYQARFGEVRQACTGVKAHSDGYAAKFLWQHSLQLDILAAELMRQPNRYSAVPHRFSIGAFLIKRSFWEEIGGFKASLQQGVLGLEEAHLCRECVDRSKVMIVSHNVFAGHFAFGPQRAEMTKILGSLTASLRLPDYIEAQKLVD